jgi:hypothetical protein
MAGYWHSYTPRENPSGLRSGLFVSRTVSE